ncbi:membrane protein insertase YidC [Actinomadura verrucosospora]|uniref:Membrane protein insertase YidC n=1 Tax=Actinomadura verrucosospora TaxID=46165 RepID=A0A7D4AS45_ACTVE|nr:membrane protein insertase YidC [Actinomadura verrucosospora]QKG23729.1 membrane protein insertase, YidC/Oxa1 family [Actinomadura verrucosospora]
MLDWLYEIVSQLIVWIHAGLSVVFPEDSGWAWGGSIILLTVLLRLLLVPLFVKQIHASRKMQELNPKVQALRKKYKNDKQRLNQEVMKLYQENGANPLSGCLPLVVQMPIFIGLFQTLKRISDAKPGHSVFAMSADLVQSAQHANIFGAHIPDTFLHAWSDKTWSAIVVTGIAVVISSCTTFFTVRASMKRQPTAAADANPMMQAQKMMVFLAPLFGLFGLGFPLGVLMYWVTSNGWTLTQQHYIYKRFPPPGDKADETGTTAKTTSGGKTGGTKTAGSKAGSRATGAKAAGSKAAAGKNGQAQSGIKAKLKKEPEPTPEPEDTKPKVVRNQPTRKPRSKRSGSPKR